MPLYSKIANALKSATTIVNVSTAAAPSSGQVLTATGSTAATWQTPSGGGGWSLKSYTTASGAASISVSSLDLATDLRYKIIVESDATAATGYVYTATINGVTTANSYFSIGQGRNYDGTTPGNENIDFKDSSWQISSNAWNNMQGEFNASLVSYDGTNNRVVLQGSTAMQGQDATTDKVAFMDMALYQTTQTNLTSISFIASGSSHNWRVWVLKPLTS